MHGVFSHAVAEELRSGITDAGALVGRVVERYRQAMERLDAAAVLALVHPTYADAGGTPENGDDLDFDGLRKLLASRFKRTTRVRYRIEYQAVAIKGSEAQVDAWIDATFVYEQPEQSARWQRMTDHNRFRLTKEGVSWRFTGGL